MPTYYKPYIDPYTAVYTTYNNPPFYKSNLPTNYILSQ